MSDSLWSDVSSHISFRGNTTDEGNSPTTVTLFGSASTTADGLQTAVNDYATAPLAAFNWTGAWTLDISFTVGSYNSTFDALVWSNRSITGVEDAIQVFVDQSDGALRLGLIRNTTSFSSTVTTGAGAISTGTEYTVRVQHDGSAIYKMWLDGDYVGQEDTVTVISAVTDLYFGRQAEGPNSSDRALIGDIRDFRFTEAERTSGTNNYTLETRPYPHAHYFVGATKDTLLVTAKLVDLVYSNEPILLETIKDTIELIEKNVLLLGPNSVLPLEAVKDEINLQNFGSVRLDRNAVLQATKAVFNKREKFVVLGDDGAVVPLSLTVTSKLVSLIADLFIAKNTLSLNLSKTVLLNYDEIPKPLAAPTGITVFRGDTISLPSRSALFESRFESSIISDNWYRDSDNSLVPTISSFGQRWLLGRTWLVPASEPLGAKDLYMEVTDTQGRTAQSNRYTITVAAKLTFNTLPGNTTVGETGTANFSVTATGNGTLSYQWYENGVLMGGETSSSLSVTNVQNSDNGNTYYVTVTDDNETISSTRAILTVAEVPAISTQPVDTTVEDTFDYTLYTIANGTGTLSYQWYQNAAPIGGAIFSSYTTSGAIADNGDTFYVEVTDDFGTVTSSTVTLTVTTIALGITTDVVDIIEIDAPSNTATFEVVAKGDAPLTYQWYEVAPNDTRTLLSGQTNSTLVVNAELVDTGKRYQVDITDNDEGPISSRVATLTVLEGAPFSFVTRGFNNREIIVDRGINYQMQPRVLSATFGEGYEQRIPDGLENLEDTFTVTISNQTREVVQDIQSFFDSVVGTTAFEFFIPNEILPTTVETIPVRCTQYTTILATQRFYTITATFERVREVI